MPHIMNGIMSDINLFFILIKYPPPFLTVFNAKNPESIKKNGMWKAYIQMFKGFLLETSPNACPNTTKKIVNPFMMSRNSRRCDVILLLMIHNFLEYCI